MAMHFTRLLSAIVFVAAYAVSTGSAAQNAKSVVVTDQVRAELLAHAPEGVAPGKPVWLGLQITHKPEWHTYWKNAGRFRPAHRAALDAAHRRDGGRHRLAAAQKDPIGNLANYGYDGTVLLPVPLTITPTSSPALSGDSLDVGCKAAWLVCRGVHSRRGRVHAQAAGAQLHGTARPRRSRRRWPGAAGPCWGMPASPRQHGAWTATWQLRVTGPAGGACAARRWSSSPKRPK
jgi:hypothetical protein